MAGRRKKRLSVTELAGAYTYVADKVVDTEWRVAGENRYPAESELQRFYETYQDAIYAHGPDADETRRAEAAEALTQFLETWFTTQDWTRLKNLLRRKKSDQENGKLSRVAVSTSTLRMIQRLLEADAECATQDELLAKHLTPLMAELEARSRADNVADIKRQLAAMPKLELAARYLMYLKYQEKNGFTLDQADYGQTSDHLTKLQATYETMPFQFEPHDAQYQAECGKWQGLAKRRWPELKKNG